MVTVAPAHKGTRKRSAAATTQLPGSRDLRCFRRTALIGWPLPLLLRCPLWRSFELELCQSKSKELQMGASSAYDARVYEVRADGTQVVPKTFRIRLVQP